MERIDDLQFNGLKLIQDEEQFCFGSDAVELANFVRGGTKDRAVDLGCGNGIITVLLAGKKRISCIGVEIDAAASDLARRNLSLNGLEDGAKIINMPMQKLPDIMERGSVDIVVCNPPYFKVGSGKTCEGGRAAARHELYVTLEEVVKCAEYLLRFGGSLYMVYTVDRLAELLSLCVSAGLEPKELVFLSSGAGENNSLRLCLIRCAKGGKVGLCVSVREFRSYP